MAEDYGFTTLSARLSVTDLLRRAPLPCIIYLAAGHFVVLVKAGKSSVRVADPAVGLIRYSREEFAKIWLVSEGADEWGAALLCEPSPRFIADGPHAMPRHGAKYLLRVVRRYGAAHAPVLALSALLYVLIQLVLPLMTASLINIGIGRKDKAFIVALVCGQAALLLGRVSVETLQAIWMTYVGYRIELALISDLAAKLSRLPIRFFEGKSLGDMLQRITDQTIIQEFLTVHLFTIGLGLLQLVVFGSILAAVNPQLFVAFILASVLYVCFSMFALRKQQTLNHKHFHLSASRQSLAIEFLSAVQDMKLNGGIQQRRWQWIAAQHRVTANEIKRRILSRLQLAGGTCLSELRNLVLLLIVAMEVLHGTMTLGVMIAVQYIMGQLTAPLDALVSAASAAQYAHLSHKRIDELHAIADEKLSSGQMLPPTSADIRFDGVCFSYSSSSRVPLFTNLSLTIPKGCTTALVGASGGGKTTIMKLIQRFYAPQSGTVFLGDLPIDAYDIDKWRLIAGAVTQEGYLFSDTIARNIALGDASVDYGAVGTVGQMVEAKSFIDLMPLGYDTPVGRDGVGLSKGQIQRILLARALYRNPAYILLDEATSALDATTERKIVENLSRATSGKTVIISAHRLSTIRNADLILVFDQGRVVESGTHNSLLAIKGHYHALVESQLQDV